MPIFETFEITEKLSSKQEARGRSTRREFSQAGVSTSPADFEEAERAVKDAYAVAGLAPPKVFMHLASPREGASVAALLGGSKAGDSVFDLVVPTILERASRPLYIKIARPLWSTTLDRFRDGDGAFDRQYMLDAVRDKIEEETKREVRDVFVPQNILGELSFLTHLSEIVDENAAKRLNPLVRIAKSCGWAWFFEGAAILTDRPSAMYLDRDYQLHCERGPALVYRDGFSVFAWHGTHVPSEWIVNPSSLTAVKAISWEDTDQRLAACDILGWRQIQSEISSCARYGLFQGLGARLERAVRRTLGMEDSM